LSVPLLRVLSTGTVIASRQYADLACNSNYQSELVSHEIGSLLRDKRGWVVAVDLRE